MKTRALLIPIAALLMAVTLSPRHEVCRVVTSAQTFHRYFRALSPCKAALNPVERVVYSIFLVADRPDPAPPRHT